MTRYGPSIGVMLPAVLMSLLALATFAVQVRAEACGSGGPADMSWMRSLEQRQAEMEAEAQGTAPSEPPAYADPQWWSLFGRVWTFTGWSQQPSQAFVDQVYARLTTLRLARAGVFAWAEAEAALQGPQGQSASLADLLRQALEAGSMSPAQFGEKIR